MPAQASRMGQLLGGKYRLEEILGSGGMGCVFGARHLATGRRVAIKLIHSELLTRPDLVRRVSREARLAVEAAHPNVVEVLDAGSDEEGAPYVVLERLYGRALDTLIGSPLPLRATVQALTPVVNALVSLHRAGIVHRDIKPSNIFLDRSASGRITPKLLDFGLAKALEADGATHSGVAVGTPAYMAPEQALGCGAIGPATDVWSMAVVFVHCLTGALPFARKSTTRLSSLRSGLSLEDLSGVPEPVALVLVKALTFEPLARPRDMQAFRAELAEALERADAEFAWPNDATVDYAPDEAEIEIRIPEVVAAATEGDSQSQRASQPLRVRPRHLATRTLSILTNSASGRPRRLMRVGLPLAIAALTAFVLALTRGSNPRTAKTEVMEPPRVASRPVTFAEPIVSAPLPREPAAPATSVERRSSTQEPPRRTGKANGAATPVAAEPRDQRMEPAVGANRSPIIE